jgi:hypothetical protein
LDAWHLDKSATALSKDEITVLLLADMFGSEYAKRSALINHFEVGRIAPMLEEETSGWVARNAIRTQRDASKG